MSLKFWFIVWLWRVVNNINLKDFLCLRLITSFLINNIWSQYFSLILISSTFFFTDGVADWGIELQELLFLYLTWKQFFLIPYFPHLVWMAYQRKKMLEKDIIWWCIFRRNTFFDVLEWTKNILSLHFSCRLNFFTRWNCPLCIINDMFKIILSCYGVFIYFNI